MFLSVLNFLVGVFFIYYFQLFWFKAFHIFFTFHGLYSALSLYRLVASLFFIPSLTLSALGPLVWELLWDWRTLSSQHTGGKVILWGGFLHLFLSDLSDALLCHLSGSQELCVECYCLVPSPWGSVSLGSLGITLQHPVMQLHSISREKGCVNHTLTGTCREPGVKGVL